MHGCSEGVGGGAASEGCWGRKMDPRNYKCHLLWLVLESQAIQTSGVTHQVFLVLLDALVPKFCRTLMNMSGYVARSLCSSDQQI